MKTELTLRNINCLRKENIDVLKTICAFFVVCIHAPFYGVVGDYFIALTRIAVPIFFMITGYFYNLRNAKKQIKKVFILLILANVLYLIWGTCFATINGNLNTFLVESFNVKYLFKFLLLNDSPFGSHLWYLGAILYVLIITTVMKTALKKTGEKILYFITPFCLIGDLILGKYSLALFHREIPFVIARNWFFVGIPYFTIGMWLKNNIDSEKNIIADKSKAFKMLIGLVVLFSATSIAERYFLVQNNVNAVRDHYISTTPLAICVFSLFLIFDRSKDNLLSRIGRNDSTWIYILHPMVISTLAVVFVNDNVVFGCIKPFVVFLITFFIVEIMNYLKKLRDDCNCNGDLGR